MCVRESDRDEREMPVRLCKERTVLMSRESMFITHSQSESRSKRVTRKGERGHVVRKMRIYCLAETNRDVFYTWPRNRPRSTIDSRDAFEEENYCVSGEKL